jgi:hypothetical protein
MTSSCLFELSLCLVSCVVLCYDLFACLVLSFRVLSCLSSLSLTLSPIYLFFSCKGLSAHLLILQMSKLHSGKLMQSVLLEVAADVMRREKDTKLHVRFRCRLKPDFVKDVNRVEFWMAWNELSECPEEIQILKIRSEITRSLTDTINDYDPSHELPDWALRLVLRDLREDVEHEADVQTNTGQKRKLYEESRKTKNISTWKLLSHCKGYLSKILKSRHKGTMLHRLHKIADGDILWLCDTTFARHIQRPSVPRAFNRLQDRN